MTYRLDELAKLASEQGFEWRRVDDNRLNVTGAKLLAKVYNVDAERCPHCGGRLRPIGAITDPDEADRELARLAHRGVRVRDPPQASFAFVQ